MSQSSTDRLIEEATRGCPEADTFLRTYLRIAHDIDDCVDEPPNKEKLLQTFLLLLSMCSINSFYLNNRQQLFPLLALALSNYATSVEWEGSKDMAEQKLGDHLRSNGAQVIEYVALLCGGIERMRNISPLIWKDSWNIHHTKEGEPR